MLAGNIPGKTGTISQKIAMVIQELQPQKRKVGYVFQNYALFPTWTVEKNIMAGMFGTKAEKLKRVKELSHTFQLEGLEHRLPGQLSGGQQQRVALVRIMTYALIYKVKGKISAGSIIGI